MKDITENYIVIQGWMVTRLKLSGSELMTFALVYGFSQDGESEFTGSISYICEWLNCSRPTVSKALDNLVQKNLLIKKTENINGVTFNRYKISLQDVKNIYGGSKETLQGVVKNLYGGSKESLHNNTIYNNKNNKVYIPPTLEEVITFFKEKNQTADFAKKVYDYYSLADWVDSKGNKVKNWKQKMYAVWIIKAEEKPITEAKIIKPKTIDYSKLS
jgi:hypothetical protein